MIGSNTDKLAYRESMQNGLADMLIASFFIVPAVVVDRPALTWLIMIPMILLGPVHQALKKRFVEPRLGYAELQREKPGRLLGGITLFAILAALLLALALLVKGDLGNPAKWRQWSPALAGVLFAGGLFYAGRRSGLWRYHLLTLASVSGGIALATLIRSGTYLGLKTYLFFMGILVFVNGLILFTRFTRNHPILEEETDGQE